MAGNHVPILERISIGFWDRVNVVRRSFQEFLAYPSLVILFFLLLALGINIFERSQYELIFPIHEFFQSHVFTNAQSTSDLLGNIAGSIITVTSITITLLLLIVQQTASNLTTQVFDQFLRRRSNQFYFGYFVGVAVYTLITLATVNEPFNPVLAASLVFLFTVIALFMLMVLFYSTIHQMRPVVILSAIHKHTLAAHSHQRNLIRRTRRKSQFEAPFTCEVRSNQHGFVTGVFLDELGELLEEKEHLREVVLTITVGTYVAYQDRIAEIKVTELDDNMEELLARVRGAFQFERNRDFTKDPAYGIQQLETIAWASTSPSKSNLEPGLQTIFNLRALLSLWIEEEGEPVEDEPLAVIYNDDLVATLFHTFESLAVVATVSMEHQVITGILTAFSSLYERLPGPWQQEADNSLLRILPTLDSHFLTSVLERELNTLIETLEKAESHELASRVQMAYTRLKLRQDK